MALTVFSPVMRMSLPVGDSAMSDSFHDFVSFMSTYWVGRLSLIRGGRPSEYGGTTMKAAALRSSVVFVSRYATAVLASPRVTRTFPSASSSALSLLGPSIEISRSSTRPPELFAPFVTSMSTVFFASTSSGSTMWSIRVGGAIVASLVTRTWTNAVSKPPWPFVIS